MASTSVSIVTAANTTTRTEEKSIPDGYLFLYAGVRKLDNTYTSPILCVHIYQGSASITQSGFAEITLDNSPTRRSPSYQLGATQSLRENNFSLDEQVLIIPVGDILSISYRIGTKKEIKIQTSSIPISNPPRKKQGCCARICFCCCYKKSKVAESERGTDEIIKEKAAKQAIMITIEYFRYGCIDTPSRLRGSTESDQVKSYRTRMNADTLQFYLQVSDKFDSKQFNLQRHQVETLSSLITRIKQMSLQEYPSEIQLQQLAQTQDLLTLDVESQESSSLTNSSTKLIPPIMTQPIHTNDNNSSGYF